MIKIIKLLSPIFFLIAFIFSLAGFITFDVVVSSDKSVEYWNAVQFIFILMISLLCIIGISVTSIKYWLK